MPILLLDLDKMWRKQFCLTDTMLDGGCWWQISNWTKEYLHIKTQDQLNLTTQVLFDCFSLLSLDVSTGSKFGHSTQGLPRLSLDKVDRPNHQKQQIHGNKIKIKVCGWITPRPMAFLQNMTVDHCGKFYCIAWLLLVMMATEQDY